jgi:outer membrane protein assembly factor BamE
MSDFLRRGPGLGLVTILCAALSACGAVDSTSNRLVNTFRPYKMDIVQGNVVSSEQAAMLKPGMSRVQVRDVLGTPLLASVFHEDRWDYVFILQRQGVAPQSRRVTVFFKNAELLRFEADTLPSEAEFAASLGKMNLPSKLPELEATAESLQKLPVPVKASPAAPLPPLPASYPPLESPTR